MPIQGKSKEDVVHQVMHEYKHGGLHSGKGGKKVKKRSQAIRIALEEARRKGYR